MILSFNIHKIHSSSNLFISIPSKNLLSISFVKASSNPYLIKSNFLSSVKSLSIATINYFGT